MVMHIVVQCLGGMGPEWLWGQDLPAGVQGPENHTHVYHRIAVTTTTRPSPLARVACVAGNQGLRPP